MRLFILIILSVFVVSGCGQSYLSNKGRHYFWDPEAMFMANLPDGDDSYSQGFRDGCNTASGVVGSGYVQTHNYAYDANRGLEDRDYYRGYRIAYNYCTYYIDVDPL